MKDRELLELAAKASGFQLTDWAGSVPMVLKPGRSIAIEWNPLTDDGDALRLAAKLHMTIVNGIGAVGAQLMHRAKRYAAQADFEGDDCAAYRLAIVRAAAELGKTL